MDFRSSFVQMSKRDWTEGQMVNNPATAHRLARATTVRGWSFDDERGVDTNLGTPPGVSRRTMFGHRPERFLAGLRSYRFFAARRARIRVRSDEMAYAPPANPARIRVGFSGESLHPPWAHAGIAAINANARAVRRKVFFIGRSYFRRDPGALGCNAMI